VTGGSEKLCFWAYLCLEFRCAIRGKQLWNVLPFISANQAHYFWFLGGDILNFVLRVIVRVNAFALPPLVVALNCKTAWASHKCLHCLHANACAAFVRVLLPPSRVCFTTFVRVRRVSALAVLQQVLFVCQYSENGFVWRLLWS
jgi:hypothetical protein